MRGLVLAAGFGTRLRPLTAHVPKALAPVCGIPLLERTLSLLSSEALGPFIVNTHHLHDQIAEFAGRSPCPFEISHEKERIRGTGGAIHHARAFLGEAPRFFVCNVEPLKTAPLGDAIRRFEQSGAVCGLLSTPVESGGTIFARADSDDYLGTCDDDLEGVPLRQFCYIGTAFYRREFLDLLADNDFSVVPVWRRAQQQGLRTVIVPETSGAYWRDIGTPSEFARAHFDRLENRSPLDVPTGLIIDDARRCCFPKALDAAHHERIGEYSWLETDALPESTSLAHTVVLPGSVLEPNRHYSHVVVTPWGEMPFA
ncbi:MAG: NTP transferase domain-containing protein [Chitinivibrionales bacterium]|nr:NTP transferase domain-containing protein [Chitinivibrionales bacterium]